MFKQFCLEGILAKESLVTTKGCHAESDFHTLNTSRSSYFFATRKYSRMRKARLAMSLCLFMYEVWLYRSRATFTQINIELL